MAVYYVIANDGREMYYRDGARISESEGKRYGAKRRASHASCRRTGKVISPRTGKCVKKGTRAYKALVRDGMIKPAHSASPVSGVCKGVKCPRSNEHCNPETGKCVKEGGRVYKSLVRRGLIQESSTKRKTPVRSSRSRVPPTSGNCKGISCKPNEVCNPKSGKCVKVGGRVYNNLLKEGLLGGSDRRKTPAKSPRKKSTKVIEVGKCENVYCEPGTVCNPESGKCVKVGARVYNDILKRGLIGPSSGKQVRKTPARPPRKSPGGVICDKGKQYNEHTGKCNKIGGRAWKNAVEKGWIKEQLVSPSLSRSSGRSSSLVKNKPLPKKKPDAPTLEGDKCEGVTCPEDKVCNPESGKCVVLGGRVHRRIMKTGLVPTVDLPSPKSNQKTLVRAPVVRKEIPPYKYVPQPKKECVKRSKLPLTSAQLKVVQYMDGHDSLLVVHGTGCGKTLTAVTCTQCYLDANPGQGVIFVGPASLTANFKKEMRSYGVTDISPYTFYSFDKFRTDWEAGKVDATGKFLVVDEAHNLRNPGGKKSKAVVSASYVAAKRLLLTATPFVNSVMDFIPLVNMLHGKKVLGTKKEFYNNEVDEWIGKEANLHALTTVRYLLKDRIDIVDCKSPDNFAKRIDDTIQIPMSKEYFQKYDALTKGLQVMDDIFSKPEAFYNGYRRAVNRAGSGYFSEKVRAAAPILQQGKSIIYSNWLDFGIHPIVLALEEQGITYRSFFGDVDVIDRERMVKAFNKGKFDVLILSKAGGEGIDLHGVRSVVILDPPWNDAGLQQVIGRAIRYNSHAHLPPEERNVTVYQMELVFPPGVAPPPGSSGKMRPRNATGDQILYGLIDKKNDASVRLFDALKGVTI